MCIRDSVNVLNKDNEVIDLRQTFEDDDDMGLTPVDDSFEENVVASDMDGFNIDPDSEEGSIFLDEEDGDEDDFNFSDEDLGLDDLTDED